MRSTAERGESIGRKGIPHFCWLFSVLRQQFGRLSLGWAGGGGEQGVALWGGHWRALA
jgi:hypothetical protein